MLVYFGLCVAIAVVTFLVVVQRFYKGLLGQEGYLMFTLPVPTWQLTLSKLLGATIMTILSGIVGILSVFILGSAGINWGAFFRDLGQLFANWDLDMTFICIELFLLGIVSTASMVTDIYIAMALGHLSNKHRVAMSFVWFIVIQTALSFLTGLLGIVLGNMVTDIYIAMALGHLSNKHRVAMSFVWFIVIQTALSFLTGLLGIVLGNIPAFTLFITNFFIISPIVGMHGMLWFSILVCLVETLIFYFGTTWVLKNKLNLE